MREICGPDARVPAARKVMATLAATMRPGFVWRDRRKPGYRKAEWMREAVIGITGSTNHIARALFVFSQKAT